MRRIQTSIGQIPRYGIVHVQPGMSYFLRSKGSYRVPIGTLGFSFSLRVLIENLLGFWSKQNLSWWRLEPKKMFSFQHRILHGIVRQAFNESFRCTWWDTDCTGIEQKFSEIINNAEDLNWVTLGVVSADRAFTRKSRIFPVKYKIFWTQ